jgi:hypothetical protein
MPTLREVQAAFARGVLEQSLPADADGILEDGIAAARRFGIYRNNVLLSLRRVLENAFPATRRLLGPERFREIALAFIRSQPPERPQLITYGAAFPAFLEHAANGVRIPHLPDVARLEWARQEAYYAADTPPLTASDLAAIATVRYPELRFELHPSLRLIRSAGPVHSLWLRGREDVREGMHQAPGEEPEQVLVVRPDMIVTTRPIAAADLVLLEALGDGTTLAEGAAQAQAADAEFDLQNALALHLAGGSFAACG